MIDTLWPSRTCQTPHKSILHNLVTLDRKKLKHDHTAQMDGDGGDENHSDDGTFFGVDGVDGDGDDSNADTRSKDIGDGKDDSIASIASVDDDDNKDDEDNNKEEKEKQDIESDDDKGHDYNESITNPNQSPSSKQKEITSSSTQPSSIQQPNQQTTPKQTKNHDNNNIIHMNKHMKQSQTKLDVHVRVHVPWQSLIQVYQHMCHQDSLQDGKTPLQRRKTHYLDYTNVIEKLQSLENRALELKLRTDSMKRKQQDLGIITGMKYDKGFKKKRV